MRSFRLASLAVRIVRIIRLRRTFPGAFALLLKPPDIAVDHLDASVDLRFYIGERLVVEMRANELR